MLYIALLRGINVGGHQVKMDDLRKHFSELGLANVRTYIQSGNVFFETEETDRQALTERIEQHLRATLGYDVPVFLRTAEELEQLLASDPFKALTVTPDMRLCITFTADPIPNNLALPLRSAKNDMEIIATTEHEAFVVWYIIDGRPPSSSTLLDKTIGKNSTTRFFHTSAKILAAARKG